MKTAIALSIAYVLGPGHPLGLLAGLPLRSLGMAAAALIGITAFGFWPAHTIGRRRVLAFVGPLFAIMLAGKLALWLSAPAYGLPASYFANGRFLGKAERSTEFPFDSGTRRDRDSRRALDHIRLSRARGTRVEASRDRPFDACACRRRSIGGYPEVSPATCRA